MKNENQMMDENESGTLWLHDKVAVIFGADGAIGSQVAREFSSEGATVFLSWRRLDPVEEVTKEIRASNGKADAAEVDALDEKAVNAYVDGVLEQAGKIDIVFNAIGPWKRGYYSYRYQDRNPESVLKERYAKREITGDQPLSMDDHGKKKVILWK
jgi:NADP-dependent 3-hydroxy acid dehydrogenase YdfG